MTFIPFIDWGKFLPNPAGKISAKAKVELPDGSQANVKTFPQNHSEVVIYPKTNDPTLNKEAFRTWQFIRLPVELGAATKIPHLLLGHIVQFVFIYGVYGNIGRIQVEKGENALVMEACTID